MISLAWGLVASASGACVMSRSVARVLVLLGACCASVAGAAPVCTLIADAPSGRVAKQEGHCDQRLTPASTFKVALSLMGYDAGFLTDEHHPALPYRDSYPARDPSWKTTIDPTSWITNSVVWYSQQLTVWLGRERLQHYVTRFNYGNQDISGNPGMNDGLTQAWLDSSLQISPLEQIAFLEKVVNRQLGVSARAYDMTARITAVGKLPNGWDVHAKGGTGFRVKPGNGGADLERQIGWYVGWATRGNRSLVFAYAIADEQRDTTRAGARAKDAIWPALPGLLDAAAAATP
jgi:beta-lactamase class D